MEEKKIKEQKNFFEDLKRLKFMRKRLNST